MTTSPPVRPDAIALPQLGTGERQRRRQVRRRLGRQQMLVILVMVLALVVTVVVLAQQWLANGVTAAPIGLGGRLTAGSIAGLGAQIPVGKNPSGGPT